jgi:hypothetical protein
MIRIRWRHANALRRRLHRRYENDPRVALAQERFAALRPHQKALGYALAGIVYVAMGLVVALAGVLAFALAYFWVSGVAGALLGLVALFLWFVAVIFIVAPIYLGITHIVKRARGSA